MSRTVTGNDQTFFGITRRAAVTGALAVPVAGVSHRTFAQRALIPVVDTHVHLFNAADLPIAGFAKYTLISDWLGDSRKREALIDFLGGFVKERAPTLEQEIATLPAAGSSDLDPAAFGDQASAFMRRRERQALQGGSASLATSYRELQAALVADANYSPLMVQKMSSPGQLSARDQRIVLSTALQRAAQKSEGRDATSWDLGEYVTYRSQAGDLARAPLSFRTSVGDVVRAFGWGYQMLKARRKHLSHYLSSYSGPAAAPRVLVNHLVDYDHWIDDRPKSDHIAQLLFYDRLARVSAPTTLLTFAGFCPLRLAIERVRGGTSTFDRLKALHGQGLLAGFKLYPPMGFRPIGNDRLGDAEFDPGPAARRTALDAWRAVSNQPLGPALDAALRELYQFCQDQAVPIMAHARRSNGAGPQYDTRADPRRWETVASRYRLNIMLGHLIDGPATFIGSAAGPPRDRSWPLETTIRMLQSTSTAGSAVYGDLGYIPEIIGERQLARDFFVRLKSALGPEGMKRVCYGTDWIMLGREQDYEDYLEAVRNGMIAAQYSPAEQAGVLSTNALAYLRRTLT